MSCQENLQRFVAEVKARTNRPEWSDLDWVLRVKKKATERCVTRVRFALAGRGPDMFVAFDPQFGEFARAVIGDLETRYLEEPTPHRFSRMILALRLLHRAFGKEPADPAKLCGAHFERAYQAAIDRSSSGEHVSQLGGYLDRLAKLVTARRLSSRKVIWRPKETSLPRCQERQPLDSRQLAALADISLREDLCFADQIRRCVADLCLCGGFRIDEALTLPVDTHVVQVLLDADGRPRVDGEGNPIELHGLRYWAGKGESTYTLIKPVPSAFVPIMLRALERAKRLTEPARAAALCQARQGTTTLGAEWDKLEDDDLMSETQVEAALGLTCSRKGPGLSGRRFLLENRIPTVRSRIPGRPGKVHHVASVRKADLYRALCDRSERGNMREGEAVEVGLHELLFVVHKRMMPSTPGLRGTARLLQSQAMQAYFSDPDTSVFRRLGYVQDGEALSITSHQFRVTLNNMAQSLGLGQAEIARWMGRVRVSANAAYDKRTPAEKVEKIRAAMQRGGAFATPGPIGHKPLDAAERLPAEGVAAHVTGVGVCHHDFASRPCPHHAALVNAGFGGGWSGAPGETDRVLKDVEKLLSASETAEADGVFGAAAWSEAHRAARAELQRRVEPESGDWR